LACITGASRGIDYLVRWRAERPRQRDPSAKACTGFVVDHQAAGDAIRARPGVDPVVVVVDGPGHEIGCFHVLLDRLLGLGFLGVELARALVALM